MNASDLFYTGVGALLYAKDQVDKEMEKLVERGKISKEEMKTVLEQVRLKGEEGDQEIRDKFHNLLRESAHEIGLATKEEVDALREELEELRRHVQEHKHA